MDSILYTVDSTPILQEPLQNKRFNRNQVRETNLFVADDLIHIDELPRRDTKPPFVFQLMPSKVTESPRMRTMRNKLRRLNNASTRSDDPQLIRILQKYWLRSPSHKHYNLDYPEMTDFSMGQSAVVDQILKGKVSLMFLPA